MHRSKYFKYDVYNVINGCRSVWVQMKAGFCVIRCQGCRFYANSSYGLSNGCCQYKCFIFRFFVCLIRNNTFIHRHLDLLIKAYTHLPFISTAYSSLADMAYHFLGWSVWASVSYCFISRKMKTKVFVGW